MSWLGEGAGCIGEVDMEGMAISVSMAGTGSRGVAGAVARVGEGGGEEGPVCLWGHLR